LALGHLGKGLAAEGRILTAEDVQQVISDPIVVRALGVEVEDDPGNAFKVAHLILHSL